MERSFLTATALPEPRLPGRAQAEEMAPVPAEARHRKAGALEEPVMAARAAPADRLAGSLQALEERTTTTSRIVCRMAAAEELPEPPRGPARPAATAAAPFN